MLHPSSSAATGRLISHPQPSAENQSPHLDALPAGGTLGGPRVDKGSVGNTAVGAEAVRTLEQQALVVAHAGQVIPLLVGVVLDGGGVAGAVRVAVLDRHEVLVAEGAAVGEGQRVGDDGPVQRPPHVDDAIAPLDQLLGLVRQVVLDAHLGRDGRLVDVGARDGSAVGVGPRTADGVVEDEDAVRTGHVVENDLLDLRVVLLLDGVVVDEVLLFRLDALDEGEGVLVEIKILLPAAGILDGYVVWRGAEVALRHAFGLLLDEVVRGRAIGRRVEEIELSGDGAARDGKSFVLDAGVKRGGVDGRRVQLVRWCWLGGSGRHSGGLWVIQMSQPECWLSGNGECSTGDRLLGS